MPRLSERRQVSEDLIRMHMRFRMRRLSRLHELRQSRPDHPPTKRRRIRSPSLSLSSLSSSPSSQSNDGTSTPSTGTDSSPSTSDSSSDSGRGLDASPSESSSSTSSHHENTTQPPRRSGTARRIRVVVNGMYRERYYKSVRLRIPRAPPQLPHVLTVFKRDRPDLFRQDLRVSPRTFDRILDIISDDPVFLNSSNNPQMPIDEQLAITLHRFGHSGNAARYQKIANWAGVGKGTVLVVTKRVLIALTRSAVVGSAVRAPTADEKEKAKEWVERKSCRKWRNGWCFVDGTLVPLFSRPFWFGESYFDRKNNYSLNVQVINLPNLRIIDFGYGFTGSTHDATAWAQTRIGKDKTSLLDDGEWVWADSAYPIDTHVVAPYKKPMRNLPENETFNKHLSGLRIKSEHAIGFLKGRWHSLKSLRINIKDSKTHHFACYWIVACVVVHNLAIESEEQERRDDGECSDYEDPFIGEGMSSDSEPDGIGGGALAVPVASIAGSKRQRLQKGKDFREKLKRSLFRHLGEDLPAPATQNLQSSDSESNYGDESDLDDE